MFPINLQASSKIDVEIAIKGSIARSWLTGILGGSPLQPKLKRASTLRLPSESQRRYNNNYGRRQRKRYPR